MSRSKTVRASYDTWAGAGLPTRKHGDDDHLRVQVDNQLSYLWAKLPVRRKAGAVVGVAKWQLFARGASTGARVVTARRVADDWVASETNWNTKPGVVGTSKTATIGALADGDMVEIDVTQHAQTMVEGAANYGWRLETDAATSHRFYGADGPQEYRPRLYVEWSVPPAPPTGLKPSGGKIGSAKPILSVNPPPDGHLDAMRVQIDPAANGTAPGFDSGWVNTTEPQLDLATTAFAGLVEGGTTQWRAFYKVDGVESGPSDWVNLRRGAKGTLTIDNPPVSGLVTEPTPPVFGTFTGEDLTGWQVRITPKADRSKVLYDSEKQDATSLTTIEDSIPFRHRGKRVLRDDRLYSINMRAWGDTDRVAAVDEPVFVSVWRDFVMNDDAAQPVPTGLTAAPVGVTPFNQLTWSIATAPDSFVVRRDGEVLEANLDPADLFTSGTSYAWRDHEAIPHVAHVYTVKGVVNGKQSPPSASATSATRPEGVWILDYKRDLSFCLMGFDVENWRFTEQGVTYDPIGSPVSVRIITSQRGMSGSFRGLLKPFANRSVDSFMNHIWKIKERPTQELQLVAAKWSIPVVLDELSPGPDPDWTPQRPTELVGFSFRQVRDLPFESRI